jgi:hypothetical protein
MPIIPKKSRKSPQKIPKKSSGKLRSGLFRSGKICGALARVLPRPTLVELLCGAPRLLSYARPAREKIAWDPLAYFRRSVSVGVKKTFFSKNIPIGRTRTPIHVWQKIPVSAAVTDL